MRNQLAGSLLELIARDWLAENVDDAAAKRGAKGKKT